MIRVLGGLIGAMLDPLAALTGIAAGLLWRRHRGLAIGALAVFGVFCVALRIETANAFHERIGPYPLFNIAAAVIWMLLALAVKAMISTGSKPPAGE